MHNTPNNPNRRSRLAATILGLLAAVLIPVAIYAACNPPSGVEYGIAIDIVTPLLATYCQGDTATLQFEIVLAPPDPYTDPDFWVPPLDAAGNISVIYEWKYGTNVVTEIITASFGATNTITAPAAFMTVTGEDNDTKLTITATNSESDGSSCTFTTNVAFTVVKAEIVSGATNCWKEATNTLSLTSDSYSPSDAYEWSVSSTGLVYT